MATQVQFRRGTTVQTSTFTGAPGELTVDTTQNLCVVHDGVTAGGWPQMVQSGINSKLSPGSLASCALKFANSINTGLYSPTVGTVALVSSGVAGVILDTSGNVTMPKNVIVSGSLTVTGSFISNDTLALIVALS
jgi:hypothetical protein